MPAGGQRCRMLQPPAAGADAFPAPAMLICMARTTTDTESYLNELVGRTALLSQVGDGAAQYLNVPSLSASGLLVPDEEHEYFVRWASARHVRLATAVERTGLGSPQPRARRQRSVKP